MSNKWNVDLKFNSRDSYWLRDIPKPPGFTDLTINSSDVDGKILVTNAKQLELKQKQTMSIAMGPGKGIFTTGFMLWMSGSSMQVFLLYTLGMALINPIKGIFGVNQAFSRFDKEEGLDLKLPKLIFISLQLLALGVALYKCSSLGLLPLTSVDWTIYLPTKNIMEYSGIPL